MIAWEAITSFSPSWQAGAGLLDARGLLSAMPYHVQVVLISWPIFAWLYFRRRESPHRPHRWQSRSLLVLLCLAAAVILDYIAFLYFKVPWWLIPRELYNYQAF